MTGIILGIFGFLATIILGYYGILLTKKSKQTAILTIKKVECFSLFSSAIRKLKIDISFNDKKIEYPLILFKGEIINTGTLDIDKTSIYEPLKLISSENFKWIEVNIMDDAQKVNSVIQKVNEREININWDLLKKGEKISFEALVESTITPKKNGGSDAFEFYNSLDFSHRITNLDRISCNDKYNRSKETKRKFINTAFTSLFIIFVGIITLQLYNTNEYISHSSDFIDMYYEISTPKNDTIVTQIIPINEKEILLRNINKKKPDIIALNEFKNNYRILKLHTTRKSSLVILFQLAGYFFLVLSVINIIVDVRKYWPRRKNRNLTN